jgi:hypothetical protein
MKSYSHYGKQSLKKQMRVTPQSYPSLTLADAIAGDRVLTQVELEYDGHRSDREPPSLVEVLTTKDAFSFLID